MEPKTSLNIFIGLDIGGTLAKLCIWCPNGVKIDLPNLDHLKAPFSKGELTFYKLKVAEIKTVFEILKKLKNDVGFKHLYVTGGGAFKYFNELQEIHGEYIKDAEISSLLKGLNFLISHVEDFSFYYRDATGHVPLRKKPDYPFLLINIGSGVSAIKFPSKDEYVRVGGTTLGGGTFLGLSNLLVGTNDFDELLELAKNGKSENADLLIKDIYHGQDSPHSSLSSENLAVSLGKLAMDHLRNIKKVKKEDMVKSFLIMVAFNISQIAYYLAKNNNIKQVYFAGNFLRQHTDTMECISYALAYFSAHDGEQINAIFLKHDGFLGALGCTLASAEKENYDITSKDEEKAQAS